MEARKILVGLTYYLPNISGLTQYASILAEELVKRNYKIRVITSKPQDSMASNEKMAGVEVVRVGGFRIGKGFIMPGYLKKSWEEVGKVDIVNCHLPSIEAGWLALATKLQHKKLIATFHCQMETGNKLFDWIITVIQEIVFWLSDEIVVNTVDYLDGNHLLRRWRHKVNEIYPPIKISKVSRENKGPRKKVVGFLGRISREKNLELLIDSMKYWDNDTELRIAGPEEIFGEQGYKNKIDELLEREKKRIARLGKVENVAEFLSGCDCLVLPSVGKLESFGMVQVEAMMVDTPSVTSNLPGIRIPIQKTGMGELFEANNAKDLADKIKLVLTKDYPKVRLEIFDYQNCVDKYEKLFQFSES